MSLHIIHKSAISLDGSIDRAGPSPLVLSNDPDFALLDEVRASCDAILVGAKTVRRDDPSLRVKDSTLQSRRVNRGLPAQPARITLTQSGNLSSTLRFFAEGAERVVFCPHNLRADVEAQVGGLARVVAIPADVGAAVFVATRLEEMGFHRVLLQGGEGIASLFHQAGLVDELHISMAPFFVGEEKAPRLIGAGSYPYTEKRPWVIQEVQQLGEVVLIKYRRPKL